MLGHSALLRTVRAYELPASRRRGVLRTDGPGRAASLQRRRKRPRTPLPQPVEGVRVPGDESGEEACVDFDPVLVAAPSRADQHDLDIVPPDADRPTPLIASEDLADLMLRGLIRAD